MLSALMSQRHLLAIHQLIQHGTAAVESCPRRTPARGTGTVREQFRSQYPTPLCPAVNHRISTRTSCRPILWALDHNNARPTPSREVPIHLRRPRRNSRMLWLLCKEGVISSGVLRDGTLLIRFPNTWVLHQMAFLCSHQPKTRPFPTVAGMSENQ